LTIPDRYIERYTALSAYEKQKRRRNGTGNFVYVRYADDWVVLCNGTKVQAEALREELYTFLKTTLRLDLSKEKTKITHLNDGFKFLGFWIQRAQGHNGLKTKVTIPKEAMDKVKGKIDLALAHSSHQDSVAAKIQALNRLIGGWCRYYQFTSRAAVQFGRIEHHAYWCMAHWLGRKFTINTPEVMRRFKDGNTFVTRKSRLSRPTEFPTLQYKQRFRKPNPYLVQEKKLDREELPVETYWTGYEARPGMADQRPLTLERDEYTCQVCGAKVMDSTAEVDHIKPVRWFKRPIDANVDWNLWTLCISCHQEKTKYDRQAESRVR
jgi:RNA-directed DNA polymerase